MTRGCGKVRIQSPNLFIPSFGETWLCLVYSSASGAWLANHLSEVGWGFAFSNGRKLISKKNFKDNERDKKSKPFEFVFPISFTMPDGISVTVNNKEEIKKADTFAKNLNKEQNFHRYSK